MERAIRNGGLRRAWKSYKSKVLNLLEVYVELFEAQRSFKPKDAGWSIAQVFFHPEYVQDMARTSMQNRIASGRAKPAGLNHSWR